MTESTITEKTATAGVDQQAASQGEGDLSKRTLIMLVALSCIISLVGTAAMVYELSSAHQAPTMQGTTQTSAKAGFTIGSPNPKPASAGATGFATFKIGE